MSHAIPSGSSPFCPPYTLTRAPTSHNCRNLPFAASLLASAPRLTQPKVGWKLLYPFLFIPPPLFPHWGTGSPRLELGVRRLSLRAQWGS